ncbi:MAG: acetate uptake transporter [Methanomassiliicoccaceae archaeon]|nr:acetate uptake transporter [Methanomassiliicoccaceae archaeon]
MTSSNTLANPSALGLFGFGMATIVLSISNAGAFDPNTAVLAMGFMCGGVAQIIAGLIDFKKNNMFGATVFTMFGLFWMTLVAIKLNLAGIATEPATMGTVFVVWGTLAAVFSLCVAKKNIPLRLVFYGLIILFALLAASEFAEMELLKNIAGVLGVMCGAGAFYVGVTEFLKCKEDHAS